MSIVSEKQSPNGASPFDPSRFNHLSEAEILCHIGRLLATALSRSGSLVRRADARAGGGVPVAPACLDPVDLIRDPIDQKLVRFLRHAGPTAPVAMARSLDLAYRTVTRKLRRLRAQGLCEATGKTRAVRYALRTDCSRN